MKNSLYILILLFSIVIVACDKEENIVPAGADDTYIPQPSDTELGSKIFNLYEKYGVAFLYDFERIIFDWNMFSSVNDKFTLSYVGQPEELSSRIDFLLEKWLSAYSDEFIKTKFPIRVLLLDTIVVKAVDEFDSDVYYSSAAGLNYISISNMGNAFADADKISLVKHLNISIIRDYLFAKDILMMPEGFYHVSGDLYGKFSGGRNFKENGFFPGTPAPWYYPSQFDDMKNYLTFYIETDPDLVEAQIGEYPKMTEKYNVVKTYIESLGINIHTTN